MVQPDDIRPLIVFFFAVVALVGFILGVTHLLGQNHNDRSTGVPYESGMQPTGSARLRFPADYYLTAMFFVVFDAASVFIFIWAVDIRELGWKGYCAAAIFVAILFTELAYVWRTGGLEQGRQAKTNGPDRTAREPYRGDPT